MGVTGERYLRAVLETTRDGYWMVDMQGHVVDANDAYCRMSGYTRSELLALSISDLDADESTEATAGRIDRIIMNGFELFETRHRRKDKSVFHVEISVSYLKGKTEGFICFCRDITDRKNAETALLESRFFNRSLLQSVPLPIFFKDLEGCFRDFNSSFEAFMGLERDELLGKTAFDVEPFDLAVMYHEKDVDLIAHPGAIVYDSRIKNRGGELRDVVIHKATIRNLSGDVIGIIGAIFDITDRKRDENTIRALVQEKDILLQETHHRIKNNMSTIIGLLTMQSNLHADETVKMILNGAGLRIKSMMVLYDKLYRSSGYRAVSIRSFLVSLVDEILAVSHAPVPVRAEIDIEDFSLEAPILSPLGIMVGELMTNSMKYAFGDVVEGVIGLTVHRSDETATLSYRDNGPGLPVETEAGTDSSFGLNLIDALVKQIGGSMRLDGAARNTFVIKFNIFGYAMV
jgi:PAS domain S-box-containing protein